MRLAFSFLFIFWFFRVSYAQQILQSPEQFLGYRLGEQFTRHYRIVEYFKQVASSNPEMVHLETYGKTYEGRPLILAFISDPVNISNLEAIRQNNLRLTGLLKDQIPQKENGPVLVWLSYDVHGNEPSSSEAAMKTLYTLAEPSSMRTREWLKNTVVILDPCLNPDGRERYVSWFNSVVGLQPDPDPMAREHREPWPQGRANHYYFDLNRDWLWQTQSETRQRLKIYNRWMPQVHVDFHEHGYERPYFFPPAAEPFHEVITPWQREFQAVVGRNNARKFDERGWLYFTRERYDLFYPSYGDTYAIFNGAIGMTYESGGIEAGLAIRKTGGDTLTLADRLERHFIAGISTIEVCSREASRLIQAFHQFYADGAERGAGDFKIYIMKTGSPATIPGGVLPTLLERNGINYGIAQTKTNAKGYHYSSGKEESFTVDPGDLIISTFQPKAALVKVLFEPRSKLSDSITYDITSWAAPYAMGIDGYAVKDRLETLKTSTPARGFAPRTTLAAADSQAFAFLIPWEDLTSARTLAQLLKAGIQVRYAGKAFRLNGRDFSPGSLIITRAGNRRSGSSLVDAINRALSDSQLNRVQVFSTPSGFVEKGSDLGSNTVGLLKRPRVVLVTGEDVDDNEAGDIWHFFEQQIDYPISLVNESDLFQTDWKSIDVLVLPEGNYSFLNEKAGVNHLKSWIQQGGRLIAIQNAVVQLSSLDGWITEKKMKEKSGSKEDDDSELLKRYENREKDELNESVLGAVYRVSLDNSHPLAFGYPGYCFTLKQDNHIYNYLKEGGWNVGVLKKDEPLSGYSGSAARARLKEGLLFGVQEMGRGQIVYLADNPIYRGFWENGKLMLANAVFMVGNNGD